MKEHKVGGLYNQYVGQMRYAQLERLKRTDNVQDKRKLDIILNWVLNLHDSQHIIIIYLVQHGKRLADTSYRATQIP